MWNVVREVTNPKKNNEWTLNTDAGPTNDEQKIANTFNTNMHLMHLIQANLTFLNSESISHVSFIKVCT